MPADEISINNEMVTFPGMYAIACFQFTATRAGDIIVGDQAEGGMLAINTKKIFP